MSEKASFTKKVVLNGLWVFGQRAGGRLLGLVRNIILARLLFPDDFGLIGLAMIAVSALDCASQVGFQQALVQERQDIRPYLDNANVFVVPLRIGGGTRVKILTAMAAGVPVVSSSIGCEGIEATHEKDILLADRPQDFAQQTLRLFDDRVLYETLWRAGRRLVESRYSWDRLDLEPMLQGIY